MLSDITRDYVPATYTKDDPTLPNFASLLQTGLPTEVDLVAYLDRVKPLSEPKWVRTGDVDEFLQNVFAKNAQGRKSWLGKVEVADPDPVCFIFTPLSQLPP